MTDKLSNALESAHKARTEVHRLNAIVAAFESKVRFMSVMIVPLIESTEDFLTSCKRIHKRKGLKAVPVT